MSQHLFTISAFLAAGTLFASSPSSVGQVKDLSLTAYTLVSSGDSGRSGGDDHSGGDDRGGERGSSGRSGRSESGDDHGRHGAHHGEGEFGDDHGGLRGEGEGVGHVDLNDLPDDSDVLLVPVAP